jgi:molecular chaperone DnaK
MAELGDKLNTITRSEVQSAISDLKQALDGENVTEIKRLTETLTHASHRLAESAYQQTGPSAGNHTSGGANTDAQTGSSGSDDDVVDAEFEEVA